MQLAKNYKITSFHNEKQYITKVKMELSDYFYYDSCMFYSY